MKCKFNYPQHENVRRWFKKNKLRLSYFSKCSIYLDDEGCYCGVHLVYDDDLHLSYLSKLSINNYTKYNKDNNPDNSFEDFIKGPLNRKNFYSSPNQYINFDSYQKYNEYCIGNLNIGFFNSERYKYNNFYFKSDCNGYIDFIEHSVSTIGGSYIIIETNPINLFSFLKILNITGHLILDPDRNLSKNDVISILNIKSFDQLHKYILLI